MLLIPPANEVCEGYVFTPICQSFCSQGGVPGQVPPGQVQPPMAGTPPIAGTQSGRYNPPGRYTSVIGKQYSCVPIPICQND